MREPILEKMLITKDGSYIYYEIVGHGKPLLFLHGNSQNRHYFRKQIASFSKEYQLILLDTRDHGKSTNTQETLEMSMIIGDIDYLMAIEKIEKFSVVGFSDGANIALSYASKYSKKINAMVLISPNLTVEGLLDSERKKTAFVIKIAEKMGLKKLKRMLNLSLTNLELTFKDLSEINVPTLVIGASHDIILIEHLKNIAYTLANGKFILAKHTGHSVPFLRPKWFNRTVLDFLEINSETNKRPNQS